MYRSRCFPLVLLVAIISLLNSPANAGVVKRSIRMVREVYPPDVEPENEGNQPQGEFEKLKGRNQDPSYNKNGDCSWPHDYDYTTGKTVCIVGDVVYGAEETVPAEQPCLKCRCQPPGVQCETVQCAKKPGCKAIHRSNRCCPDYQCECEHNGKIYANGEKLETNPGGECKVCYCRGGELQCAEVSCYIRKDCEGKRVPGTCCPKYDHCPPIDAVPERTYLTTEAPLNTLKPVVLELWQDSTNATDLPSIPTLNNIPEDSNKVPDTSDSATVTPSFQEIPKKDEGMLPRITIQEIIPERKEIPITAPPKIYIAEPQGTLLIEEALPTNENTSNDLNIDTEPDSSEISEVFQHPPPILRIGDKLLFLKKGELVPEKNTNTPQSVITIIGAEGLQRGGVEESLEVHEIKIGPELEQPVIRTEKTENDVADSRTEILDINNKDEKDNNKPISATEAEDIFHPDENQTNGSETNDLELKTAESTHILSLLKKKKAPNPIQEQTTPKSEIVTTQANSIEEPLPTEVSKLVTDSVLSLTSSTPMEHKDLKTTFKVSTIADHLPEPTTESQTKNTEPISEQNPAYPPLPDDMPQVGDVSQKFEIELENDNQTTMEIKILPEVYDLLSNKTKNQTHSDWLKYNDSNDSLVNFKDGTLPDDLLNQKSPVDEEEDGSVEVTTLANENVNITTVETNTSEKDMSKEPIYENKATDNKKLVPGSEEENKSEEKKVKLNKLMEGAQLIAEVRISEDLADFGPSTMIPLTKPTLPMKTLPEVRETEDSDKKSNSIVKNVKEDIETSVNAKELAVEYVKMSDKSVESLEIDSGEQTTPKSSHSAMVSGENASVEKIKKEINSETSDMVQSSAKEGSIEVGSVELTESTTKSMLVDVELIGMETQSVDVKENKTDTAENMAKQDFELINVMNIPKPTKAERIESSTYELLPTPEEAMSKSVIKRAIASETNQDDVFKDLEREINAEKINISKNPEEEKNEADKIFDELMKETKASKGIDKPKTKEEERINDLSNALAGVVFKRQAPDASILRLIGGFFGRQNN